MYHSSSNDSSSFIKVVSLSRGIEVCSENNILLYVFNRADAQPLLFAIVILSFLRQRKQNHMFLKGSAGADNATLKASELSLLGKPVRMRICHLTTPGLMTAPAS